MGDGWKGGCLYALVVAGLLMWGVSDFSRQSRDKKRLDEAEADAAWAHERVQKLEDRVDRLERRIP